MNIIIKPINITTNVKGAPIILSTVGGVGIKGDKGDKGDRGTDGASGIGSNLSTFISGENIGGHTAVYIGVDGKAYKANPFDLLPIQGISVGASDIGTNIEVQHSGVIYMDSWNFSINSLVFVLGNGQLSTTQDITAQYSTVVGISNSSKSLVVNKQPQMKLI